MLCLPVSPLKPMILPATQSRRFFIAQGAELGLTAARLTSLVYTALLFLIFDFQFLQSYFQDLSDRGENYILDIGWVLYWLLIETFLIGIIVFFAMLIGLIVGSLLGLMFSTLAGRISPRGFILLGFFFCLSLMIGLFYRFVSSIGWTAFWTDHTELINYLEFMGIPQLIFTGCGVWVSYWLVKNNRAAAGV